MTQARFRQLAVLTLAATLGVILWGAYVRATGSGAGCGSHWPTCNGDVIPRAPSVATLIEYTHRATSGLAFLLVALQLVWALRAFPAAHPARLGAGASMFFMVTEAAVGAGLVLFEYVAHNASVARAVWMSVHLINTFLLIAAMALTVWWSRGNPRLRLRGQGSTGALLAVGLAAALLVGVTGAIAALGDTLFAARTLAEGLAQDLSPTAHFLVQLRVLHPVIAGLTAAYLLFLRGAMVSRSTTPTARRLANLTGALVAVQVAAGLLNLVLLAPVWLQLVHLLLADLLWMTLVALAAAALGEPAPQTAGGPREPRAEVIASA